MASSSLRGARLVEFFLHVRLDRAVRRRVCDAREHEAVTHLVVVQERLVGLVDGTSLRAIVSSVSSSRNVPSSVRDSSRVPRGRVTSTYRDLTRARRACARAARVRQVDAGFLRASQKKSPLRQSRALATPARSRATRPTRIASIARSLGGAASASRDAIRPRSRARDAARDAARVATRRLKIRSSVSRTHLSGVEDVRVVRALDRLRPLRGFERDLEVRDRRSARDGGGGSARAREGRDGGGGDGHLRDGGHCVCVLLRGVVSTRRRRTSDRRESIDRGRSSRPQP